MSPRRRRSASPGVASLNLAETARAVSGSTKTRQPVAVAICTSNRGRDSDFISALTWFLLVFQIKASSASPDQGRRQPTVRHNNRRRNGAWRFITSWAAAGGRSHGLKFNDKLQKVKPPLAGGCG